MLVTDNIHEVANEILQQLAVRCQNILVLELRDYILD